MQRQETTEGIRYAEYRHCIPKKSKKKKRKRDYGQGPEKGHYTVCMPEKGCV
jgi:hypothetical protein